MHLQQGAIKQHTINMHHTDLTRQMLTQNTKIIHKENNNNRLQIKEALLIKKTRPTINKQYTGSDRILTLFQTNTNTNNQTVPT